MTTQTKAERLAGYLDDCNRLDLTIPEAAAELRRQASFINDLMDEVARLKKAVADEREACAVIGDSLDPLQDGAIGKAIRARGENT